MLGQLTCHLYEFKMMGLSHILFAKTENSDKNVTKRCRHFSLQSKFLLIANGENTDKLKEDKKETKTNKGKLSRK